MLLALIKYHKTSTFKIQCMYKPSNCFDASIKDIDHPCMDTYVNEMMPKPVGMCIFCQSSVPLYYFQSVTKERYRYTQS